MLIPVLLFILGLILLIKGGDWFVDSATGIAHKFRMSELLIGATVVSIGTTLPEVMVSATSALSGHGEIAYGNAIGSIICNTALIAAITITLRPSAIDKKTLTTPVIFFFASALFYSVIAYTTGYFSRTAGIILLIIFVIYIVYSVISAKSSSESSAEKDNPEEKPLIYDILLLIVGAAMIAWGANLLVENGTIIAKYLGVPESVIALTFVALGTSLPELVTAITSLIKGHGLLSLGNIVGANIFNLVLVSGVSTALSPFAIPQSKQLFGINTSLLIDIPVMFAVMLLMTLPALKTGKLKRYQGILLLIIYSAFCIFQFSI